MTEKLLVPDIGDFENVEVIELLVKEGQEIKKNDPVITIESDKSSVEIPSIFSGKIESINVKVGDKVSKGDLILNISNVDQKLSTSQDVPKNTENLIQEAESSLKKIQEQTNEILELANSKSNTLSKMNKGAKEVTCKVIDTPSGSMLIVELLIDVGDAMGANVTNTMCEAVSPLIGEITGGKALLRILSNYFLNSSTPIL